MEVYIVKLKFEGNSHVWPKSAFLLNKNCFRPISGKRDGCPRILFLLMKVPFYMKVCTKKIDFSTAGKKVMIFQKLALRDRFFVKIREFLEIFRNFFLASSMSLRNTPFLLHWLFFSGNCMVCMMKIRFSPFLGSQNFKKSYFLFRGSGVKNFLGHN